MMEIVVVEKAVFRIARAIQRMPQVLRPGPSFTDEKLEPPLSNKSGEVDSSRKMQSGVMNPQRCVARLEAKFAVTSEMCRGFPIRRYRSASKRRLLSGGVPAAANGSSG